MKRIIGLVMGCLVLVACGSPRPPEAISSSSPAQPQEMGFPETMVFEGRGQSQEFSSSRKLAYQDVMRQAIVKILGERDYTAQKTSIDGQFLANEAQFSPYILQKEWTSTKRDENGNLVLALKATIATKKLREDLRSAGFLTTAPSSSPTTQPSSGSPQRENSGVEMDLSGVDISGLSLLIFYNPEALQKTGDPDAERYARRAIQLLNQEFLQSGLEVIDLEAAERVLKEKNLLQEEARGNVGLGLLIAQQVHAELYGEVTPTVSYRAGTTAHVILDCKLYVRTGGRVIASIQKGGEEYDSASLEASVTASMRDAVKKVSKDLFINLKKYVKDGRFYTVRLIEVGSARDASAFAGTVSKLERVKSVKQTLYSKNDRTAEFEIQFQGSPNELMEIIFDGVTAKPGFESLDLFTLRGNELIFTMQ
ncbi:hypothetical protein [Thermospira aquatica]|uniref:Lipoprotein n=1 Tax=Thermospira aquatica TaxID=2828656 RepID=A0AAX3BAW3_9SPIR|nr:hypothetical protein [Thermospira aquatica]URA09349.1 hypothetical protein KDW03_07590 [Thermospira aquatica]